MRRSGLSGMLFGATALALVTASTAVAQQSTGQDATQQQSTQPGSQAAQRTGQGSEQASEQAGRQETAQQQAGQQVGQDKDQLDQRAMDIQRQLQDASDALARNDAEAAQQALQQADQQIQDAMQEAEGDQQHAMSELQQQIQEATQAIEQQDADGARAALDEARTKLQEIRTAASEQAGQQGAQQAQTGGQQDQEQAQTVLGGQQQGQDMQQAMYEVRQQLQQVREAVEQQNFEEAEQALQQAEQALDQAQMAAQQGGGQQGDISVSVVPTDQQDQSEQAAAATQEATRERLSAEETNRLLGLGEREMGEAAETLTLTPLDLEDRDVITMDGEEVGEVAEVVSSGGTFYAVIEHGGFLGIGEDRVAIPLERIGMRGEEVILLGLTPEQLEAMPEYDFEADEDVANEQSIEIGRYE